MALREAKKGVGRTSPNPAVGAVVVANGELVGKGYHRRAGTPHAEVHALRAAGKGARGATIYVTLEPCNHTGRTPPCTQAILDHGISRVVIGMADPNPHVPGGGAAFLAQAGLEVTSGLMAAECQAINLPFCKHIATGRPWVIMKGGISLDGRLAARSGESGWITNEQSRREVHRLRDRVDAILIGAGTALQDDPSLTCRLPRGKGRDPLRVVLDRSLRLPAAAKMLTQTSAAATWIFCGPDCNEERRRTLESAGAVVKPIALAADGQLDLNRLLETLGQANVTSVLVEGGGQVHASFLGQGLVDQVILFVAPIFIGGDGVPLLRGAGVASIPEAGRLRGVVTKRFGDDVMISGFCR